MARSVITKTEREKLVKQMKELLAEYGYCYTSEAVEKIVKTWASNKADLITAFKKHPNYKAGQYMIAFDYNYERKLDPSETSKFVKWFCCRERITELRTLLSEEMIEQANSEDAIIPRYIYNFFENDVPEMVCTFITKEMEEHINGVFPEVRAREGQKTNRVVGKICRLYKIDQLTDYQRMYARYADSLTPLIITRHTALSINPMDYLTMSFGNSWASCHTIDKSNKRGMPNSYSGCYSSGTISYMLDGSSMVFYTVDGAYDGNKLYLEPKLTRQMFHWGEDKLVQARLYPQGNDGDGSVYTPNRAIVQEIMATIMEQPNLWTLKKGIDKVSPYIESHGTHYRDYLNFNDCNISLLQSKANENSFIIGHKPICVECGNEHNDAECINCCSEPGRIRCADCGREYDDDDVHYIDGEPYCSDCCSYCDYCNEWTREETTYINGTGYVCETCRDEEFYYCEICDEYVRDATFIEDEEIYVCDSCYDECFITCDDCGSPVRRDDCCVTEDGDNLCDSCYDRREDEATAEEEADEEAC